MVGTPTKTWQFDIRDHNNTVTRATNQTQTLLNIKDILVSFTSNPWTVRYSCDSVTAGTAGDGVDRWIDVGDLVHNTSGNAHSWIVLAQSGLGGLQIVLDYDSGAGGEELVSIIISLSSGFTGGTTTARPTATDEISWISQSEFVGATTGISPVIVNGMMSSDGECTRLILTSENQIDKYFAIEKLKDSVDNWTTPYVFVYADDTTYSLLTRPSTGKGVTAIFNGNVVYNEGMCTEHYENISSGETSLTFGIAAQNDLSGKFGLYPTGYFCRVPPYRGRHGEFYDLYFIPESLGSGEAFPSTSVFGSWAVFGNITVPWNGSAIRLG